MPWFTLKETGTTLAMIFTVALATFVLRQVVVYGLGEEPRVSASPEPVRVLVEPVLHRE